ncbi:MAG: hypothetical protein ACKO3P_19350 [Planctomycetaceae bacterium]
MSSTNTTNLGEVILRSTGSGQGVQVDGVASFKALRIEASNGITVNANLLTFTGDLKLISDSDGIPNGSDSITVASGKTLSSRRDLILDAGTGQVVGLGALSLAANRDVELRSPLTSGMLALSADLDRTGDGVVRVGANSPIRVDNAPAVLSGADIELGSTISTGSGSLTFQTSRADIRIGVGDSSQTYRIDQIELNRIIDTTGLVTFGSSTQTAGISIAASEEVTLVNASRDLNVRFLTAGSVNIGSRDVNAGALLTITADADRSGNGLVDQQGGRVRVDHLVVSAGAGIDLKTSVRELTAANATSGALKIEELDDLIGGRKDLILRDVTQNGPGILEVSADGNILVQRVVTALGEGNLVRLKSSSGDIRNHSDPSSSPRLITRQAVLEAAEGIGSDARPLETSITSLAARVNHAGDISVRNFGSAPLTLGEGGGLPGVTNQFGNIRVVTDGNISTQAVSSDQRVALQSLQGMIVNGRSDTSVAIAANSLALRSAQGIGTSAAKLTTSVSQLAFVNGEGSVYLINDKVPELKLVSVDGIATTTSGGSGLAIVDIKSQQNLIVMTAIEAPNSKLNLYSVGDLSFQKAAGLTASDVMTIRAADFFASADTVNPFAKTDGIKVVTSEGSVSTPYPDMTVSSVKSFNGSAQLTLQVDAGMDPYVVTVVWSAVQFTDTTKFAIYVNPALPPGGDIFVDTPAGDIGLGVPVRVEVPPTALGGGKTTIVINHQLPNKSTSDSVDEVDISLECEPADDLVFEQRSGGMVVTSVDTDRNSFGKPITETLQGPVYTFSTTIVVFASAVNFVYEGVRTTPQVNIASPSQEQIATDQPVPPAGQVQVPVSVGTVEEQSTIPTLRFVITPITEAGAADDLGGAAESDEFSPGDLDTLEALRDYFRKRGQDGRFRVQVRFGDVEREQFEVRVQDGKIVDDDGDSESSEEGQTPGGASLTPRSVPRLNEHEDQVTPEEVVRKLPEAKSGAVLLPAILGTAAARLAVASSGSADTSWEGQVHSLLSGSVRSVDGWLTRLRRKSSGAAATGSK